MTKGKIHYAWFILIGCCFLQAGALGILANCAGIFFAPVTKALGIGRGDLALYLTIQGIAMIIALPFVGKILPKFNIRITLSMAILAAAGAMAAMSRFTSVYQWYIAGIILGVAGAFIFAIPAPTMINNWFKKKSGLALGIAMSFSGVGAAIFGPVGTSLISSMGWSTAYLILAGCSLALVLPFTLFVFRFKPSDIGMQPYGAEEVVTAGSQSNATIPQLTGVTSGQALKSAAFYIVFLTGGLISLGASFSQHIPGYAVSLGYSAALGATMLSMLMLGNLVGKLGLGAISDMIGVMKTVIIGLATVAIGLVLMFFGGGNSMLMIIGSFLFGVCMSLTTLAPPIIVRSIFGTKDFSSIFSNTMIGASLFGSFGVSIIGFVFDGFKSYVPVVIGLIAVYVVCMILIPLSFAVGKKLTQNG